MLNYNSAEDWSEFEEIYYNDSDTIIIDLRDCSSEDDYYLALTDVFFASFSNKFSLNLGLSGLVDVASDYFAENWLNWKIIYILGWQKFIKNHPEYSQRVAVCLSSAYVKSISYMLRGVLYGEIEYKELKLLDAVENDRPKLFLVLN